VDYAIQDVVYLAEVRDRLIQQLESRGRLPWLDAELEDWLSQLEHLDSRERWRRVPGLANLAPRSMAIARRLWGWREAEAERLNRPPRRILRDDLLVELAKRSVADVPQIRALRGMEHRDKQKYLPAIADCIREALELPRDQWPKPPARAANRPQFTLLSQFVAAALGCLCRDQQLAASLVGTVQDVRDLIAYRLGAPSPDDGEVPALARGWRAAVVGRTIEDLLAGRLSFFIADPLAEQPLGFEPRRPV
jgi:ribonuclease D